MKDEGKDVAPAVELMTQFERVLTVWEGIQHFLLSLAARVRRRDVAVAAELMTKFEGALRAMEGIRDFLLHPLDRELPSAAGDD